MDLLTLEDEKFKTVEIREYKFKIRYISPKDRLAITQRRARLQNGQPVEVFMQGEFIFLENVSIVDTCVEEYPKAFKSHESCLNWPDGEIITDLADAIKEHTADIQSKLKKNKPIGGIEEK